MCQLSAAIFSIYHSSDLPPMSNQFVIPSKVLAEKKARIRSVLGRGAYASKGKMYKKLVEIVSREPTTVGGQAIAGSSTIRFFTSAIGITNLVQVVAVLVFAGLAVFKNSLLLWPGALLVVQYLLLNQVQTHLNIALAARIFAVNDDANNEWFGFLP